MNPPKSILWGPENEALLKSLRLRAGIDLATLARRNIVSTTQVRQLEDGGDSSFYSSDIKFSVGKKLLKFLGHELKAEVAIEQALTTSPDLARLETPSIETFHSKNSSGNTAVEALIEAGAIVVGVAVIVERGAEPKITQAGYEYRAAYQLADLGL